MSTAVTPAPQAVAKRELKDWLGSEDFKAAVGATLPQHITPDRFVRIAILALSKTPKLAECTKESVLRCMMDCSQLGIEPDGRRAHLIPFNNKVKDAAGREKWQMECSLIIDYKGLVELAYRSGTVSNIHAEIVCENDVFTYDRGEVTEHVINFRKERGEMYAAWVRVRMKDGAEKVEVMSVNDIERVRSRSKSGNNGPWKTDYAEMAKKTVFRRCSKWLQLSPEIRDTVDRDDEYDDANTIEVRTPDFSFLGAAPADSLADTTEEK